MIFLSKPKKSKTPGLRPLEPFLDYLNGTNGYPWRSLRDFYDKIFQVVPIPNLCPILQSLSDILQHSIKQRQSTFIDSCSDQGACGWRWRGTHNNELILLSNMQDNINIDTDNYINIVSNIPYYKIFSNSSPGVSCLGCWPPVAWSLLAGRAAWAELTWLYCIWSLIFLMFLNCLKIRL